MKAETIRQVRESWARVQPISDTAASLFYDKLFEIDPALRPLFKGDINEQGKKLMTTLNVAVNSLSNLPALTPVLQQMGKRHAGYGVKDKDYDTVGAALIWTLGAGLKDAFTDEVKAAWLEVYTLVADTMKAGAK